MQQHNEPEDLVVRGSGPMLPGQQRATYVEGDPYGILTNPIKGPGNTPQDLFHRRFQDHLENAGVDIELVVAVTLKDAMQVIFDSVNDAVIQGTIVRGQADTLAKYLVLRMFPSIPNKITDLKDKGRGYIKEDVISPEKAQKAIFEEAMAEAVDIPGRFGFDYEKALAIEKEITTGNLSKIYEQIAEDWKMLITADPANYKSSNRLAAVISQGVKSQVEGDPFISISVLDDPYDPTNIAYMDYLRDNMSEFNKRIIQSEMQGNFGTLFRDYNMNVKKEDRVIKSQNDFEKDLRVADADAAGRSEATSLLVDAQDKPPTETKTAIKNAYDKILALEAYAFPSAKRDNDEFDNDVTTAQDMYRQMIGSGSSVTEASNAVAEYLEGQARSLNRRSGEARLQAQEDEYSKEGAWDAAINNALKSADLFTDPEAYTDEEFKAVFKEKKTELTNTAEVYWTKLQESEEGQSMSVPDRIAAIENWIDREVAEFREEFPELAQEEKTAKQEEEILAKFKTKAGRENYIKEIIGATQGAFSLTDEDLNVLQQGLFGIETVEQADAIANEALSNDYQQRAAQAAGQVEQKAQRETYDKIQKRFLAEEGLTPDEVDQLPPESRNLVTQEADGLFYYRPWGPPSEPEGLGRMPPPLPSPLGGISLAQERQIPIERGIFGDVFRGVGEEAVAEGESPAFLNFLFGRQAEMEEEYAADKERQRQADLDAYLEDIAVGEMGPISRRSIIPGLSPWEAGLAGDEPHPGTGYTTPPSEMSPADQIAAAQRMSESRRPIPIREDEDDPKDITGYRKMPDFTPGRFFGEQEEELRKEFESTPAGIMSMIQGKPEPTRKRKARTVYRRARI